MSDYVHNKVIRLPFPNKLLSKFNVNGPWECEPYLKEKLGNLWDNRKNNSFQLTYTESNFYLDWVYYSTYGESSGDFGHVRLLTSKELNTIKPYFDKFEISYLDNELHLVDYCYYNCAEPPDYYNIEDNSNLF